MRAASSIPSDPQMAVDGSAEAQPSSGALTLATPIYADSTTNQPYHNVQYGPWSVKEDVALMASRCIASNEKTQGKIPSLWARVAELFEQFRARSPNEINSRNLDQMMGRYKRLTENAASWVAAYEEAYHTKKFSDPHGFEEVMRYHPKWAGGSGVNKEKRNSLKRSGIDEDRAPARPEDEGQDSSKRSRINQDGEHIIPQNPETIASEEAAAARPTAGEESAEEVRELRLSRNKEAEPTSKFRTERMELEFKKEERKVMKLNVKLLIELIGKPHLSAEEQELKSYLISAVMKKN